MTNYTLFHVGDFAFTWNHLLIIGILAVAVSISFMLRSLPANYGYEINEFDPYFNYRATSFIVENGYQEYLDWYDYKSWYPGGREVSATSQGALHLTAAVTYNAFGGGMSLRDFIIIFPVIFGSFTALIIFALVRVIGGTTAGLLSALFFSVSAPILIRGTIGWFKSEPLGLFYGILAIYLFLSGIKTSNYKVALLKLVGGGIFLSLGLASWGGIQFFILPLGVFFLILPFLRKDHKFQIWAVPTFVASLALGLVFFERPGISFVTGLGGLAMVGPVIFLVVCNLIQMYSSKKNALRNALIWLACTMVAGAGVVAASFSSSLLTIPSFRYLHALNPLFKLDAEELALSVSEHASTTLTQSFYFHSILIVFAGIAIWLILHNKHSDSSKDYDKYAFALILGITGVYISSAFIRLELFASVSLIILASIGISILLSKVFQIDTRQKIPKKSLIPVIFSIGLVVILIMPLNVPANGNWTHVTNVPPTILNGGTAFPVISDDWKLALEWMKNNTDEDAIVASWWDYGYWITVLGERTSIVDNATFNTTQINLMAQVLVDTPENSWNMLQKMEADYILTFVAAREVYSDDNGLFLYDLRGGGDESKKQWFVRTTNNSLTKYFHSDGFSGTDFFWNETLLGQLFPYSPYIYLNPSNNLQYPEYRNGSIPLYVENIKYPADGDGPFRLAYSSPSFNDNSTKHVLGIFIYEINKNYTFAEIP